MISKKMKYAIKALCYLGEFESQNRLITAIEISNAKKIPKKFLEQILLDLKKSNLIHSKQGNEGGYYLLKKINEINLADLYRIFEGPIALLSCASENFYRPCEDCQDEENCKMKLSFKKIRLETLKVMETITIDKLI